MVLKQDELVTGTDVSLWRDGILQLRQAVTITQLLDNKDDNNCQSCRNHTITQLLDHVCGTVYPLNFVIPPFPSDSFVER